MRVSGEKILIVLHGSIGDVARALPLLNLLRRAYPHSRITWAVEPPSLPVVGNHPSIDEVLVLDRPAGWKGLGPFLRQIRSGEFDLVLDLQRHLKSGLISRWSGAPFRLGFHRHDSKEGNWIFNSHHIPPVGDGLSKMFHYLKFAEYLGIGTTPIEWKIKVPSQEMDGVAERLRFVGDRFAVFFVGTRWESKQWFPRQTDLGAREVYKRFGLSIVLLGARQEMPFAQEVEASCDVPLSNWVGQTSLGEAIGILSKATVAVGPDTGLMHLSAAVGTPVVSLWGATSPARTGPHGNECLVVRGKADCSPCYLRKCPIGRICMQSIEMDEVLGKVEKALTQGSRKE